MENAVWIGEFILYFVIVLLAIILLPKFLKLFYPKCGKCGGNTELDSFYDPLGINFAKKVLLQFFNFLDERLMFLSVLFVNMKPLENLGFYLDI